MIYLVTRQKTSPLLQHSLFDLNIKRTSMPTTIYLIIQLLEIDRAGRPYIPVYTCVYIAMHIRAHYYQDQQGNLVQCCSRYFCQESQRMVWADGQCGMNTRILADRTTHAYISSFCTCLHVTRFLCNGSWLFQGCWCCYYCARELSIYTSVYALLYSLFPLSLSLFCCCRLYSSLSFFLSFFLSSLLSPDLFMKKVHAWAKILLLMAKC